MPDPRFHWLLLGRFVRLEFEAETGLYHASTAERPRVYARGRTRALALRALGRKLLEETEVGSGSRRRVDPPVSPRRESNR